MQDPAPLQDEESGRWHPLDLLVPLLAHRWLLLLLPLATGVAALGITYLIAPVYTARASFLPPQQQQTASAAALASLGALSGLAGTAASLRSPADQYVALMQSTAVADRIIDVHKLMSAYGAKYRFEARQGLGDRVRIAAGKKDGLIYLEVDDTDPERAAAIANLHIDELRRITGELTLTEAQQRRAFFENHLKQTRDRLTAAQLSLQASGFNPGALKAEPKAAAEGYARLQAELTSAEVRLQTMRRSLADSAAEVQQQLGLLAALRREVAKAEAPVAVTGGPDYVTKYREYKYQEMLFELFSRQYELARLDESREGALIQVVDAATPPERKSRPKRALIAITTTLCTGVALAALLLLWQHWQRFTRDPRSTTTLARLRAALGRA
jgi:uncharacterized protein involved in exopolysaccharide biosynthesis